MRYVDILIITLLFAEITRPVLYSLILVVTLCTHLPNLADLVAPPFFFLVSAEIFAHLEIF